MGKSNNDRSNSKNPNNASYKASVVNRGEQLNSNSSAYKSSRYGSNDSSESESDSEF